MANYVVSDTNLASVADAIRAKGGTSAPLSFPTEFVSAIQAIPTGGGGGGDSSKPVRFLDYDGTVAQSYTAEEFAALEAMPENPDHSGDEIPLTAQGWNWSLADAKAYVAKYGALEVGQMYITTDGKTHIKIYIDPDTPANRRVMTLRWQQSVANGVTVNWGDGTEPESFSGTGAADHDHAYVQTGWYHITLAVNSGTIQFGDSGNNSIFGPTLGTNYYKRIIIRQIYLGSGLEASSIKVNAFRYCSSMTSITIPNSPTSIGSNAFSGCDRLTSITLPNGVTTLGSGAFTSCYNLTSVSFPNTITSAIGSQAFSSCDKIEVITLPDGVTGIDAYAFQSCYALVRIVIPDGVMYINSSAFQDCGELSNVTIPDSVTTLGTTAFSGCRGLKNITLSSALTSIGNNAFQNCSGLTAITIPGRVTSIGSNAFQNCYSLVDVALPNNLISIGSTAFSKCYSLAAVMLPDSLTSIGGTAFSTCSNLSSIALPSGLTSIPSNAFENNYSLTKITIPSGIVDIGNFAFYQCYSVSEYHVLPTTPPTIQSNTFVSIPSDCIIYVPAASVEGYKAATNWSALASKIQAEPA